MGGRSSTSAETQQTDNRRVLGEGSVSAENSTVNQTAYTYQQNLGADVVDASLDFAGGTVNEAFKFGDGALNFAGDSVDRTLGTVDRTVDTAFAFGGDALAGAYQFGAAAMTNVTNIADTSMEHSAANARASAKTAQYAIDTASDTFGSAFSFGAGTIAKAFDSVSETGAFVKDAYADAKGRGAMTDKILIGALIAVAVVAFAAVQK